MSPRPYQMAHRQAATDATRERILAAAHELLAAEKFSDFTMEAVARNADVSRLTVYYQFNSKAGLLEALYDHIAKRGHMERLAEVFRGGNDPVRTLHDFIAVFAGFWASDRNLIRRLHALAAIDPEIAPGLQARNERRRHGLKVIVERYSKVYLPLTPRQEPVAIDTLHMLTSFETFDALAKNGTAFRAAGHEEVVEIIRKLADHAIGFKPRFVPPSDPPSDRKALTKRHHQ
jgi:AcrR family transcriptional regulator